MTTLLHVCCADCLLRFLVAGGFELPVPVQKLVKDYRQLPMPKKKLAISALHLVFLNPNLYPKSEFHARLKAVQKLASLLQLPLTVADYQPQQYFTLSLVKRQFDQLSSIPGRCEQCQRLRLAQTITLARNLDLPFTRFSTTMLASGYLSRPQIVELGKEVAGTKFWQPDFLVDPTTLKTSGFYKQNYCGCAFSLLERARENFQTLE